MVSRREWIGTALGAGGALALHAHPTLASAAGGTPARGQTPAGLNTKPIPSTGERLPVIGLGTNAYDLSPEQRPELRDVMERFTRTGGSVYDTATGYSGGQSESVIGEISAELGVRDRLFLVTKIVAPDGDLTQGRALFQRSLERLKTNRIDGLLVHNLNGARVLLPEMQDWKSAGRIRYLGISTSRGEQYGEVMEYLRTFPLDIVQVDYSVGNRDAELILALAAEKGIAVMVNSPFGGRRNASTNFQRLRERPLPDWAAEYDIGTWPQFFLKYVVSHPAVTVAVPGTRRVAYLQDNIGAARGRIPDESGRKRMEDYYGTLPD